MEIENVKRTAYWITLGVIILLLGLFQAVRLPLLFRLIVVMLLAVISSMYSFEDLYSLLSIIIVLAAAFLLGALMAEHSTQFWLFSFLFVLVFFLSCKFVDKKLLGLSPD